MDLWIVAAATGAGYVAKYWQNQSKDGDALSQLSFGESNLVSSQYSNHLLSKFAGRKKRYEDVFANGGLEGKNPLDISSAAELSSTSGFENERLGLLGNHQDVNVLSIPSITWKSWIDENCKGHGGESSVSGKMANDLGILVANSSRRIGSSRNRSTAKARFSHGGDLIKPLSSVKDCLMAQSNMKQIQMEDHHPYFLPSSSSLTFGSVLEGVEASSSSASTSSSSPCIAVELEENKLPKGFHYEDVESACGVSQPPFGSLKTSDAVSNKTGKGWESKSRSSSEMVSREHFATKGPQDESFKLYLGVLVGIMYSFISNKREVHELKELLKQTVDLVQDLQEELEMKDSLKLKELVNDNCESYTFSKAFSEKTGDESSPKHAMDYTVHFNAEELYKHKAEESSESMSRIEAELEAELERLGLSINTHGMEIFSDMDELDPDFVEDFAEGESRNDMMNGESSGWTKPNQEQEATDSTAHSGNYTVSPRELSLRLHDFLQSRLEARIEELENALQNNHRKLQLIDTECKSSWLELGDSELQFSSNEISPNTEYDCYPASGHKLLKGSH